MRLVVQRVSEAVVSVEGEVVGKIPEGYFVLVGFGKGDTDESVVLLAEKLSKLRVMDDGEGKMNLAAKNVLVVSQFTLYGNTKKGNRPSFVNAAEPKLARELYGKFVDELKKRGLNVETGRFGEYMDIQSKLHGPVTILLES